MTLNIVDIEVLADRHEEQEAERQFINQQEWEQKQRQSLQHTLNRLGQLLQTRQMPQPTQKTA